jgi:hypothetical protein
VLEPDDATIEARIERIVYLGFEVRIEFRLSGGPRRSRVFTPAAA